MWMVSLRSPQDDESAALDVSEGRCCHTHEGLVIKRNAREIEIEIESLNVTYVYALRGFISNCNIATEALFCMAAQKRGLHNSTF